MLNQQRKKDPSGSTIKTLAATSFHARCEKHGKLAKMRVVKNLLKSNYGRPFFVCSDQTNPCSFWAWAGDVQPVAKPKCRHGFPSVIRKVKKETINKGRLFFCVLRKIRATTSNGCPKNLIATLNSFHRNKMTSAKNSTQQRTLSTISLT